MAELTITDEAGRTASRIEIERGMDLTLRERADRRRVAILHQPGAPSAVAERVSEHLRSQSLEAWLYELPDGEQAKSWRVVGAVGEWMAAREIGRLDTVVGVGGGAATDVAGFVAATWLRGIEAVQVPTTLLGAVDAAIGGKTGLNLAGKNLVGAFWHPSQVLIDLDLLDGLPDRLKREGMAEALKAACIADIELVDLFRRQGMGAPLDQVVPRAVAVKAAVVSEDFRESGRRAILNFGHTIGHGIEIAGRLSHGEAVAVGMVAAAAASRHRFGFASDLPDLVASLGLPVTADAPSDQVRSLITLDKKRDEAGLRMVLLRAYGDPVVEHVDAPTLAAAMASVGLS